MQRLLSQRSLFLGTSVSISIKDRDLAVVRTSGRFWKNEVTYPLDEINPEPARVRRVDRQWALASAFLGIFAAMFLLGALHEELGHHAMLITGLAFALPAAYCAAKTVALARGALVYFQVQTHAPLFVLGASRPSREEVDRFVAAFAEAIRAVRYPREFSPAERLTHFRRHVEFLHLEDVISAVELAMILDRLERRAREAAEAEPGADPAALPGRGTAAVGLAN
ncbi:hypothetical protein [Tautonia plasticadhaerens]|uniref:Uncharacterized protein n=1 Tax=Tautonia plasticadhaerens TaxID=2527974 RepID=A0A518H4P2_9BACT|nr:hypothetical protein [Tautonia plasticadhaerens]QDV35798.1 hypothetical protein ElP_37060 [Tautonia plasticadhaerens]